MRLLAVLLAVLASVPSLVSDLRAAGADAASFDASRKPRVNLPAPRPPAAVDPARHASIVTAVVDRVVVSRYTELKLTTAVLLRDVEAWCAGGAARAPDDVKAAFRSVVRVWGGLDYFRFGPARDANRLPRFAFWPDPRGVVRRQVDRALEARQASSIDAAAIAGQSAALQGLPALELLIFSERADETAQAAAFRCRFAAAVAANAHRLAVEMLDGWTSPQGWRSLITAPGGANAIYKSEAEAVSELVRSLLTGLQLVRDSILVPWLKSVEGGKRFAGLPFEVSGATVDYVAASTVSLAELSQALHLDEVAEQLARSASDKAWISGWMRNAYASMARDAPKLLLPAAFAAAPRQTSAADLDTLQRVRFHANGMRQVVGREIAPAAGALIGFNELDGD